jgi:hypothetical protein
MVQEPQRVYMRRRYDADLAEDALWHSVLSINEANTPRRRHGDNQHPG